MNKLNGFNEQELIEKVASVFRSHASLYSGFSVKVDFTKTSVEATVSQMYEHLPLTFSMMMELAEIFGTKEYNVNTEHYDGCETCDYGSNYSHTFYIPLNQ